LVIPRQQLNCHSPAIGAVILIFTVMTSTYHAHATTLSPLGFGAAVELNVTMALSWLPLIGDYTQKTQAPVKASFVSISGYLSEAVSCF
jgi:hypothetical protein